MLRRISGNQTSLLPARQSDRRNLTVFNPDSQLLELIRHIASGEGLFVWKPTF